MRQAARRRSRDESRDAPSPAVLAGTIGPPIVRGETPEPPPAPLPPRPVVLDPAQSQLSIPSLIALQRDALRAIYSSRAGVTRESYCLELVATARTAAADGDYTAAANLYKLIGQHIGALTPTTENHLHVHAPQSPSTSTPGSAPTHALDLRSASDDALRALITRAKAQSRVIEAAVDADPAPIVDSRPAPAVDAADLAP